MSSSSTVAAAKKPADVPSSKRLKRNEPLCPPSAAPPSSQTTGSPSDHENDAKTSLLMATSDSSRNKCIEMFFQALQLAIDENKAEDAKLSGPAGKKNAALVAIKIEQALYGLHGAPTNDEYKKTFRSRYLNLKDKSNPHLRRKLLAELISAEDFVRMSATEMASEERRREDDRIINENLMKAQAAKDTSPETDMFQCGRCKQRKCKYYQMQTRSADEPMTTYVTCINCGHRWKM